jgi:trk system potassium uptake protein TrkA
MILGGEYIGFHIAKILEQKQCQVKIIEPNKSRCDDIAAKLHHATVIHGKGTDSDFLRQEGISSTDVFIATTSDDELNIISGLLAKSLGVTRNIVTVNKPDYIPVAEKLGIDVALSSQTLAAGTIVRFVSRGDVVNATLLNGEDAQAIEFVVEADTPVVGKELGKVKLPRGTIVGAVVHEGSVIMPQKETVIQAGDHVIIVCLSSVRVAVDELFQ